MGRYVELLLINIYLGYCRLQLKSPSGAPPVTAVSVSPAEYTRRNRSLLRAWSYIGSTTHITVCVGCALAGNLELFLLITVLPLNALMGTILFFQTRADRALNHLAPMAQPAAD
jgi:hypothetical protein